MTKTLRGISLIGALTMASAGAWLACGDDTSANNPTDGGSDATSSSSSSGASGSSGSSSGKSSSSSSGGKSSSSGGSSSSSSSSSGGSDAGDAGPPTCTSYCALIQSACTGQYQQYASTAECMTACQYFGTADADTGNTLLCHNEHANNVVKLSAPNPHCWHAGPYGWGVCGNQCDDFCILATSYCVADAGFDGSPPYASLSDCTTACASFANVGDSGTAIVTGGDAATSYTSMGPGSGNTLDCREWHLGNALTMPGGAAQALHCQHPGADSGVCQ